MHCPLCREGEIDWGTRCGSCGYWLPPASESKCPKCRSTYYLPYKCEHCNNVDQEFKRRRERYLENAAAAVHPPPPPRRHVPPPLRNPVNPTDGPGSRLAEPKSPVPGPPPPVAPKPMRRRAVLIEEAVAASTAEPAAVQPPPPQPRKKPAQPANPEDDHTQLGDASTWSEHTLPGTSTKVTMLIQPQKSNCGPSCLCIAVNLGLGRQVSLGMMGAYVRGPKVRNVVAAIDYSSRGTGISNVLNVLQNKYRDMGAVQYAPAAGAPKLSENLANRDYCRINRPTLCFINWRSGSGHVTVCVGSDDDYLYFADPYYGAVRIGHPVRATDEVPYDCTINSTGRKGSVGTIRNAIFTTPKTSKTS